MHVLEILNRGIRIRAIVMQTQKVRRIGTDAIHKVVDPLLALGITAARRADELILLFPPQRDDLLEPDIGGLLGQNAIALRLVEVVDDLALAGADAVPVVAGELSHVVDHGAEGGAVVELGGGPGVPVAYGYEGAAEIDFVHGPGDAGVGGAVGVGPVPEEAALEVYHGGRGWHGVGW